MSAKCIFSSLKHLKTTFVSRAALFPKEHCLEVEYKSFKWVERFKYFEITLTNQNSIQKKLKAD